MPGSEESSGKPWWLKYWPAMVLALIGYVPVCVTSGGRWLDATTAYVLLVTLVVLWWYAHWTKRLAEIGQEQGEHSLTLRHESNKPFVVLERVTDPDRGGLVPLRGAQRRPRHRRERLSRRAQSSHRRYH